jgi:hypothetical protein
MTISLDEVTYGEIETLDHRRLASETRRVRGRLSRFVTKIIKKAVVEHKWGGTDVQIFNPYSQLKDLADMLNIEADTLEQASDEKTRADLQRTVL